MTHYREGLSTAPAAGFLLFCLFLIVPQRSFMPPRPIAQTTPFSSSASLLVVRMTTQDGVSKGAFP